MKTLFKSVSTENTGVYMAKIYLMTMNEAEKLSLDFCLNHFPKRLERAKRFRFREDYLRCIGAGALLYGILSVNEDNLVTSENGKLSDPTISKSFSISHSGDYVLLCVDNAETGADIQLIDVKEVKLSKRVCTPDEAEWLKNRDSEDFFTIWTLKESVMKLTGLGMKLEVRSFSVLPLIERGEMYFKGKRIYSITDTIPGYSLSYCSLNPLEKTKPAVITAGMFDSE